MDLRCQTAVFVSAGGGVGPSSAGQRVANLPCIRVNCKTPCWTHNHHETGAPRQAGVPASIAVIRLPVDEFSMNLASQRVDHGYLQILVVAEALAAEVPDNFLAVRDRFRLCLELGPDDISVRDAVFHIEEEFLHRITSADQSGVPTFVPGAVTLKPASSGLAAAFDPSCARSRADRRASSNRGVCVAKQSTTGGCDAMFESGGPGCRAGAAEWLLHQWRENRSRNLQRLVVMSKR